MEVCSRTFLDFFNRTFAGNLVAKSLGTSVNYLNYWGRGVEN